jgi:cytochrome oxidase Cu insertion factor (SCO1/SenC/PrrC family)
MGGRRSVTAVTRVAACAVAVILLFAVFVPRTHAAEPDEQAPRQTPGEGVVGKPRGGLAWRSHFPNVELTTHNRDRVRFYDDLIKGKIVVINFMYTKCTDS